MSAGERRYFILSCVVDQHPRFYLELLLWTICAQRYLPPDCFELSVYLVGDPPLDISDWLAKRAMQTRRIVPVLPASPHCNKIAPFLEPACNAGTIVCDVDLFFVNDLAPFITSSRFRAPPNNHCNPPSAIFETVLAASQLGRPYRPGIALFKGEHSLRETHINNISGGLIVAPAEKCARFGTTWRKWAEWLLQNRGLLSKWTAHVDQVAFALTMEDLKEDVEFLPPQTNAVLHLLEEITSVCAFHLTTGHIPDFPRRFNSDGTLRKEGLNEGVARAVDRLNDCITEARDIIRTLPSTRNHLDKFLNPMWRR